MTTETSRLAIALVLATTGLVLAGLGIYVAQIDDAPGAGLFGILLLLGALALAFRTLRRRAWPIRRLGGCRTA